MNGLGNWWQRKRAEQSAKATKIITGIDPRTSSVGVAEEEVRLKIATMVRELFDAGADPILLIQCYLVGAVWLADNANVSREQLAKLVHAVELKKDRQLIYTPGG